MIIGVAGTLASGKGAVVEFLKSKGFQHYSSSETLKQISNERGLLPNREHLSELAEELSATHTGGVLGINFERALADGTVHSVFEAIHRMSEADFVRSKGGKIIGVDADLEVRYRRALLRKEGLKDAVTFDQFKESVAREEEGRRDISSNIRSVIQSADIIIMNNGSLDALRDSVDRALVEFMQ